MTKDFQAFFAKVAPGESTSAPPTLAHPWQRQLAASDTCDDQLIRVPTGFGKTLGVLTAWLWHRVERNDDRWPRRLIWCLPMRVLVEQTESEARRVVGGIGKLWSGRGDHDGKVGVHVLMGGSEPGDWHLHPEHCAMLIGTQDMLLSRALNRGYASPRARWPQEFGLLSQDALWVMDEVQLMDVGLATSAQLQQFRRDDELAGKSVRPCRTWWMSATLQRAWLEVSPDTRAMLSDLRNVSIPAGDRHGTLWDDVRKPVRIEAVESTKALARLVAQEHVRHGRGQAGPTLAVVNRVDDAVQVHAALLKDNALAGTDIRLAHSRFRPADRATWRASFLSRENCGPGTDRIVVSTQVIEAGVDISGGVLVTQMAPWASLVQRFGRAARWGGEAAVIVVDHEPKDDKAAAPYDKASIDSARHALALVSDVSPRSIEVFEDVHPELLAALYPYVPTQLVLRHEVEELFDTAPDLSGADVDISRFIRFGDERDVHVFWRDVDQRQGPAADTSGEREELCGVPVHLARQWLFGEKSERLKPSMRAWVWDYLDGVWKVATRRGLYPGQVVLVAANCGGYSPDRGWEPTSSTPVPTIVVSTVEDAADRADRAEEDEALSVAGWQTVGGHGYLAGVEASAIAQRVAPSLEGLFGLAGRWHDVGKTHQAFCNSIRRQYPGRPDREDLAKAPRDAWEPRGRLYRDRSGSLRRGFRHEFASTLALFAVLIRRRPSHDALLGPWRDLLAAMGVSVSFDPEDVSPPTTIESDVIALDASQFDLLAYLVCSHHGKVRMTWHAAPADQVSGDARLRIRGVREGDVLPEVALSNGSDRFELLPSTTLTLEAASVGLNAVTGKGWTERVLALLDRHGPFTLAYLEALLRAADQRASREQAPDPLLTREASAAEVR